GGTLILVSVRRTIRQGDNAEPWLRNERLAWTLIGLGCIGWAFGECFWRYYQAAGETTFPSLADIGYTSLPPLVFAGLILQPSRTEDEKRKFVLLDSLIVVGSLLSIAWFLLLGSLAQTPSQTLLAKVVGLYYPTADTALVSCTVFLLLRGSADSSARR